MLVWELGLGLADWPGGGPGRDGSRGLPGFGTKTSQAGLLSRGPQDNGGAARERPQAGWLASLSPEDEVAQVKARPGLDGQHGG